MLTTLDLSTRHPDDLTAIRLEIEELKARVRKLGFDPEPSKRALFEIFGFNRRHEEHHVTDDRRQAGKKT